MNHPNILLLTIDTVRVDSLGCYGAAIATPNMDRAASAGVVFDQAITNGSYTKSAFPPLFSSTYASEYGGPFTDLSRRPMLAPLLQEAGYRTAAVTANPLLGANLRYDAGFDWFAEPVPAEETRSWLQVWGAQAVLRNPLLNQALTGLGVNTLPHPVYLSGEEISDRGIAWASRAEQPFFLWLHYMDAHWPYHDLSSESSGRARARAWRDLHIMWESRGKYPGDEVMERLKALYAASVERLDAQIGRVIREVDAASSEAPVILIAADHGEAFHEHGRWQHGAVYDFSEEIIRVPLIVRAPEWSAGERVTKLVSLLDVAPTLLDLAGIEVPSEMHGSSLTEVVDGRSNGSDLVITEMLDLDWYCVALRTDRYKYTFDERRPNQRTLHDLHSDPAEVCDLFGERPQVEERLEQQLQQHLERVRSGGSRNLHGDWEVEEDVVRRLKSLGYIE